MKIINIYVLIVIQVANYLTYMFRKDADKLEKIKALREASKRANLGPESLPSICFYTLLNSLNQITAAEICEDSSILGIGFADSVIKIWSLTPSKLRGMKNADLLSDIDREAGIYLKIVHDNSKKEITKYILSTL